MEKENFAPETIVQPKYFQEGTKSITSLFNESGAIEAESVFPKTKDLDFLTLKERQNSLQYSEQIDNSFCIAPLVGATRHISSAYIIHAKKSDNM